MPERNPNIKRDTARAIVWHDGKLLAMERWRDGKHYFSLPGGGIEPGESPEDAVVREVKEETGLTVAAGRHIYTWHEGPTEHKFFACQYISGEPHLPLDSEEAQEGPANKFLPRWVTLEEFKSLSIFRWGVVYEQLLHDLPDNLPEHTKVLR